VLYCTWYTGCSTQRHTVRGGLITAVLYCTWYTGCSTQRHIVRDGLITQQNSLPKATNEGRTCYTKPGIRADGQQKTDKQEVLYTYNWRPGARHILETSA